MFAHYSSFTKILANYISEESFINVYDKNMSQATFLLRTCQDPIRREMTEGSSIEFIGYGMLQHELIRCTVLFIIHTYYTTPVQSMSIKNNKYGECRLLSIIYSASNLFLTIIILCLLSIYRLSYMAVIKIQFKNFYL